jgi:hypothetical protein
MQFGQLKRREFITLPGSVVVAWPLAPRAEGKIARIGILGLLPVSGSASRSEAFRAGPQGRSAVTFCNVACPCQRGD